MNNNGCQWREELPSARTISHHFHTDADIPSPDVTHMVTQWGQFLDHDITATAETMVSGNFSEANPCCRSNPNDENCYVIDVEEDSFYRPKNGIRDVTCLEFHRSRIYCEENGAKREQFNENTHYIDASNVYGHSVGEAEKIRLKEDGLLKTSTTNGSIFLPLLEERRPGRDGNLDIEEFAGDFRAREMPGLLTMHTLFVREHNRLASKSFLMPNLNYI